MYVKSKWLHMAKAACVGMHSFRVNRQFFKKNSAYTVGLEKNKLFFVKLDSKSVQEEEVTMSIG